jgi:hypothetical protein
MTSRCWEVCEDMDLTSLRNNFKTYIRNRFPNDNHPDVYVSMAFFLQKNEREFGLNFQDILDKGLIPDGYRSQLESLFTEKGRKNPKSDSYTYERALRLLMEFIHSPAQDSKTQQTVDPPKKNAPVVVKQRQTVSIATPTKAEVLRYLDNWDNLSSYKTQEDALNLLFHKTFPLNSQLSEVLLKCSTLNDFYGTNIYGVFPVAKHIVSLNIDSRLTNGDEQLVNDIARGHGVMNKKTGKELHLFSFATKYCSHHNDKDFPIYDSYVEKLLIYYQRKDGFFNFRNGELRDYPTFKAAILAFQKAYSLESFSLKQIDQYLWQLGKEMFPKKY